MRNNLFFRLLFSLFFASLFWGCSHRSISPDKNIENLKHCNVVWNSPSGDANGSMPIGNGDVGLNVWVEDNGDICFFIGKTDAWGDNGRLLKVGKVRVKCEPAVIAQGAQFTQELDLASGTIKIHTSTVVDGKDADLNFNLWVDANNPVIHITHECSIPLSMTANIELWRTEEESLPEIGVSDLLEKRDMPGSLYKAVVVQPDDVIKGSETSIGWYHHNSKSVGFDLTNKLQGLSEFYNTDPILHRTFGALITGSEAKRIDEYKLQTKSSKQGILNVFVLTEQPSKPNEWEKSITKLASSIESTSIENRKAAHDQWWSDFWNRSWIYATASDSTNSVATEETFTVTRAYNLQRFIDASAGRGKFPIKFNGSIFTVPAEGKPGYADYRRWGPGYWWQNTRLPYLSMCAAGDYDLMEPLIRMYVDDIYPLCKKRTKKYFGFDGVYFPECMYFWGSTFTATYGWTPYEEREDPLQESGWHKWEWVSGLELVYMMLDYYDYTLDEEMLIDKIIPLANDVMRFFDNYYKTDDEGELVMYPSMACETWWDCTNPMPELAGLHAVTMRLLALDKTDISKEDREFWNSISSKLPEIPLRETPSGMALAPAERFEERRNVENPELYAVFPFRLFGVGNDNLEWGKNALKHRWDKGAFGWRQDDIFMAYMGLTEEAKANLVKRASTFDKKMRFPAFWGPNYDWTPDQDHGGVMMKAFQSMLLQADPYSKKIYLTPAWPKDWNASFKLQAPYKTTLEGKVVNGELQELKVFPEERRNDIVYRN
ncbi:hypothetical protein EYV94_02535 [Puteibacter caeruleilacunae]|nr:hypothetical protein EYV94_02535 [Puteibacter caeruleilacunae]